MFSVRGQCFGVWGHLSSHLSSRLSLYLLLTVVLYQALHVGGWWPKPKGMIEEDASYNSMYYVGKNLTVQCIKFSDFTGDVYFQQGNINYSPEYVTQINTTHAMLDKPVTDDDFGETTLTCADGDGPVAAAHIYTDYAPQEATDLKMVWLDEEVLSINWAFNNILYKNDHADRLINITGEWSYNATNASGWNLCYTGDVPNTVCSVSNVTGESPLVYVRVNITNVRRDDTVTTVFPGVPIRDHVKPLPVSSVNVLALNSTSVRVDVTNVLANAFYAITYNTSHGNKGNYNTTSNISEQSFVISGLHPAYNYTFHVRCKYEADRGYLSEPVHFDLGRMPEDVPSTAPVVTPGGFYLDCSDKSANATAFIYYQDIPDEDKNGEILNYTATVVVGGTEVTYTQAGTPRTVKLDSVPCDGNYDVTLHANTAVGPSPGAVLHVPQWSEGTDSIADNVKLKLQWSNGRMTAEWEPVAVPQGTSLLLYYCHKASNDLNMCQSEIGQVNITAGHGSYPVPSADPSMKFGVAAILQDNTTNGIEFTDCIYDPQTDKSTAKPVNVEASGLTDSITVRWEGLNACSSNTRIIIFNYEIKSGSTETEHKTTVVADTRDLSFELIDVAKNTNYTITVRANTSSGMTDFSQPAYAVVPYTTSGLNDEEIAGIALAALLVVFILGALVFCFCRDKFRAVKAKFSRSIDIPAPTLREASREFHPAGQAGRSSPVGISNQGFEPVGTSATVTYQHQDSQDSGYIGNDNSPSTPRQVALQGTDSVPPTGPTDLTITDHTQSTSPDSNVASTADVTMANGDIQGDDSVKIVSSGDTVGKGIVKDSPPLSDAGSNSYVRFSTEDYPRQGGEHLPGSPAQVVINFSKGKGTATFEPVVGVVNVALLNPGTTPTAVNSGDGVDSEAKLDPKKEDDGWAATASPGYVTHDVTTLHTILPGTGSSSSPSEASLSMEDPSPSPDTSLSSSAPGGRLDEPCNPANVNPEPENPIQQELSPTTAHLPSVLSTLPVADTPPQQPVEQEGGAVLDPPIDRDIDPAPQGRVIDPALQGRGIDPAPQGRDIDPAPQGRDIDPAPQGPFDQKSEADIPSLSAMPGSYVLRHATSPDVSLPCPPPVQDEDDSEGGSQHTEKDAARPEESGSSLSESTPSHSSNGGGYVPLDTVEKMTLILDSSAAMVTADERDAGGREGGGGRGGFKRLDSGYSSPNSLQRSPKWRSSPGFTSVQETPHNDNDDGTFNMTPAEPAMAPTKTGVAKQSHGERIKGENAGKERGSLGGALVMSSSPMRQATSGYVERNDVFAAPSETSA